MFKSYEIGEHQGLGVRNVFGTSYSNLPMKDLRPLAKDLLVSGEGGLPEGVRSSTEVMILGNILVVVSVDAQDGSVCYSLRISCYSFCVFIGALEKVYIGRIHLKKFNILGLYVFFSTILGLEIFERSTLSDINDPVAVFSLILRLG